MAGRLKRFMVRGQRQGQQRSARPKKQNNEEQWKIRSTHLTIMPLPCLCDAQPRSAVGGALVYFAVRLSKAGGRTGDGQAFTLFSAFLPCRPDGRKAQQTAPLFFVSGRFGGVRRVRSVHGFRAERLEETFFATEGATN